MGSGQVKDGPKEKVIAATLQDAKPPFHCGEGLMHGPGLDPMREEATLMGKEM